MLIPLPSRIFPAPPSFVIKPTAQTVEVPADVSFECKSTGNPPPTLFWSVSGNRSLLFPGNRMGRYETTAIGTSGSVFTISHTERGDNDLIVVCSALNSVGAVSARAKLMVTSQDDKPPPLIIHGPVNQTLPVKSVAVLTCAAVGHPSPVISWYRDGIPVPLSPRANVSDSGTLTIGELDKALDAGLYTCVASSRNGKATWSALLKLESPTNPNIKFNRAPEMSVYPSSPGKPKLVNTTAESVTIQWMPSTKTGASELIGYQVEMFSGNISKSWIPLAHKYQETVYTQPGLTLGASYIFVVRAANTHGLSSPSAMSEPIIVGKVSSGRGRKEGKERTCH